MILCMYVVPRQGLTTPWGRNFYVNKNIFSLRFMLQVSKKSFRRLILYIFFFIILYMYIAPRGQSFDVNKNVVSLRYKFQNNAFEVWFCFSWFNTCI